MSCPNSEAPKCCPPPKKPCPPGPPTCSNLPATLTFTCPSSEDGNGNCGKKEEKPACPPEPCPETCVALGNAKPEPISSSAGASSGSGSSSCASGGSPNSCESAPLSMDGKKC